MKVDPHLMLSLLKVPEEKIRDKMIAAVEERVTSIEREGIKPDFEKVGNALVTGFSNVLGIDFIQDELTPQELKLAEELAEEKYESRGWNHRR